MNLLPASGIPELLQVRISSFSIDNAKSTEEAISKLLASREVKTHAAELHLNSGLRLIASGGPNGLGKPQQPFEIRLRDVTVIEGLNAIIRSQGHGVWEYRETHWRDYHGYEVNLLVP